MPAILPALRNSGEQMAGVLITIAGALLLALAPTTMSLLLAMALLVIGLTLRPTAAPALLALSLPFYLIPKQLGSMAFSLPELVLLCSLAAAALYALRRSVAGQRSSLSELATPLDGPAALFLGAALLSLLASQILRVSLRDLRTLVLEPLAAYYLATWLLQQRAARIALLAALLLGGAAASALGLYQYFFTDNVVAVEGARRILGPYLSPNHLGLYLGRILPMVTAVVLFLPSVRVPALLLALPLAAAQILTFSLGAWLATLLALLSVLMLWRRRAAAASAGAAAVFAVLSIPLLSIERISSHFSLGQGTSFIRIQLWESALQMIRDHPLLGVGMDNFLYYYRTNYLSIEAAAEPNLSHPHNLVLNFWLQMGILGVVAVSWILAALARLWVQLWRSSIAPLDRALLAGIAGAAVDLMAHGMVDNSYFLVDLAFHFWLSAGLLVAMWKDRSRIK